MQNIASFCASQVEWKSFTIITCARHPLQRHLRRRARPLRPVRQRRLPERRRRLLRRRPEPPLVSSGELRRRNSSGWRGARGPLAPLSSTNPDLSATAFRCRTDTRCWRRSPAQHAKIGLQYRSFSGSEMLPRLSLEPGPVQGAAPGERPCSRRYPCARRTDSDCRSHADTASAGTDPLDGPSRRSRNAALWYARRLAINRAGLERIQRQGQG